MKCPICGREVDDALELCDLCGSPMKSSDEDPVQIQESAEPVPYMVSPVTQGQYAPENAPQFTGTPPAYLPVMPVKKKKKKWPWVILCVILVVIIAVVAVFAVFLSKPEFVVGNAVKNTFIESENLSFEITISSEGEEICFEGAYVRGDTPEEAMYYIAWDQYIGIADESIRFEYGFCDGKLYSSFGEFDMKDADYWSDVEELLSDEFDIDANLDDIYTRLTDKDITDDEMAKIFDEELFPIIEQIIYAVTGEEVEFPPFADIRSSVMAFFEDFADKYIVLEEVDFGEKYSFEINVDTIFEDFLEYMKEDETLSQILDITDVLFGDEEERTDEDVSEDEGKEDLIISGNIFINEDWCIEKIEVEADEVEITVEISDVNETELDESDIMDIDVLFDINEANDFMESF